ncbi:DUF4844 domain-containing protein [Aquirhabdus sp.]|uniref:DUF4844 domain-containing protein n=1 Tax=Aquirhabdus sp. TaxID=2824160 RepID=UPI00396C56B5
MRCFSLIALFIGSISCCANQQIYAQESSTILVSQYKNSLEGLVATEKFTADGMYTGTHPEVKRIQYEASVNNLIKRLISYNSQELTKQVVLSEFKSTLKEFDDADSDDKDCMLGYLERIMGILGIDSSDGVLNKWRYGLDPRKSREQENIEAIAQMTPSEQQLLSKLKVLKAATALTRLIAILGPPSSYVVESYVWFLDEKSKISFL